MKKMIKKLILKNRSYRRFDENVEIPEKDLLEMIDNARLSASARNAQPLKYIIIRSAQMREKVFPLTAWAGYLKNWNGPEPGERPSAYIIQLNDTEIASDYFCDDGIAAQSILLTAVEKGFGGCIIASVKREQLGKILELPENLKIIQIIALGKPAEEVRIEKMQNDDIKYWRDENEVHHVPKRSLEELVARTY